MPMPASLFGADLPPGLRYGADFISEAEEVGARRAHRPRAVLQLRNEGRRRAAAGGLLRPVIWRRRTGQFTYPLPAFLLPLRARLAEWARITPEAFAMALINEYPPGAPIGWPSRRAAVRHHRGRLAAVGLPHEAASL
jgi:hypothetical protein